MVRPELFAPDLMRQIRDRFHHTDFCPIVKEPRVFFENGGGSLKLKEAIAANAEIEALPDQEGRKKPGVGLPHRHSQYGSRRPASSVRLFGVR